MSDNKITPVYFLSFDALYIFLCWVYVFSNVVILSVNIYATDWILINCLVKQINKQTKLTITLHQIFPYSSYDYILPCY